MKKLMYIIAFAAVANSYASQGVFQQQNDATVFRKQKNNAFEPGEALTYRLHYGAIDAGEAKLTVKTTDKKVNGRDMWHVVGEGRSLGAFDWFFKVRDRYESYIDKDGVFPWLFVRRVNEGGFEINQDYTFYQHKKKVNTGQKEFEVPAFVQDMISAFYYARTIDFSNAKVGDIFTVETFLDDELFPLQIKYVGKETIKTRTGKYRCMKFRPVVQKGRIFKSEEDLNVWITDDGNKIPILAKAKILVGSIKMELTKTEGLKNEMAKV
jgi:hypothetical protein